MPHTTISYNYPLVARNKCSCLRDPYHTNCANVQVQTARPKYILTTSVCRSASLKGTVGLAPTRFPSASSPSYQQSSLNSKQKSKRMFNALTVGNGVKSFTSSSDTVICGHRCEIGLSSAKATTYTFCLIYTHKHAHKNKKGSRKSFRPLKRETITQMRHLVPALSTIYTYRLPCQLLNRACLEARKPVGKMCIFFLKRCYSGLHLCLGFRLFLLKLSQRPSKAR